MVVVDADRIIQEFLDAPGTVTAKKDALKKLTGRQMASLSGTPDGRSVLKALAFHAAIFGGVSGGQLKAINTLLADGSGTIAPGKQRMTLTDGDKSITVEAGGMGDED